MINPNWATTTGVDLPDGTEFWYDSVNKIYTFSGWGPEDFQQVRLNEESMKNAYDILKEHYSGKEAS